MNSNIIFIENPKEQTIISFLNLNIDFFNMAEAAYHFEDEIDGNLEILQEPIEVGVFENQYFVEDGHHRILQKINDLEIQIIDFLTITIDAILIFHNEKPNYLISENCKYGKIKDWYESYYETKL